jgi:putative ABC transport system substrate-binding protein
VALILTVGSSAPVRAAMSVTSTIPIVFAFGGDPVNVGSLSRPGANATGAAFDNVALLPKRLELLRELMPSVTTVGFLLNPTSTAFQSEMKNLPDAAAATGTRPIIVRASTDDGIEAAIAALAEQRVSAFVVSNDAFMISRRDRIVAAAARHKMATAFGERDAAVAGGLMSYAPKIDDSYRQAGIYTGRILKGEKPADLPIVLPIKYELVINSRTARELGIMVPLPMLMRVDEVIE